MPNKAAVLDGLVELVLADLPPLPATRSWRVAVRRRAHDLRRLLRDHPNTLPLFASRPAALPGSLERVEEVLRQLRRAGFGVHPALAALHSVVAYVVGHCAAWHGPRSDLATVDYGALDPARFPYVREAATMLAQHDVDREFELGLEALVSGLARHASG